MVASNAKHFSVKIVLVVGTEVQY